MQCADDFNKIAEKFSRHVADDVKAVVEKIIWAVNAAKERCLKGDAIFISGAIQKYGINLWSEAESITQTNELHSLFENLERADQVAINKIKPLQGDVEHVVNYTCDMLNTKRDMLEVYMKIYC